MCKSSSQILILRTFTSLKEINSNKLKALISIHTSYKLEVHAIPIATSAPGGVNRLQLLM